LAAFSRENRLKYAVICAKRGEILASYAELALIVSSKNGRNVSLRPRAFMMI
jgi:hypothetical protein